MFHNPEMILSRQLVLRKFTGGIVQRLVKRDEFCALLLSRRSLERCNDDSSRCRSLFDSNTGELFDIHETDLLARAS